MLIKGKKKNINENELSKIMKPNYKKNSMLNREIEKNYFFKKRIKKDLDHLMLTFKTHNLSHEVNTKPIKSK
jgi:hypothetical protein